MLFSQAVQVEVAGFFSSHIGHALSAAHYKKILLLFLKNNNNNTQKNSNGFTMVFVTDNLEILFLFHNNLTLKCSIRQPLTSAAEDIS